MVEKLDHSSQSAKEEQQVGLKLLASLWHIYELQETSFNLRKLEQLLK
jgi:hypothetical protein